jgi:hypothetical protein
LIPLRYLLAPLLVASLCQPAKGQNRLELAGPVTEALTDAKESYDNIQSVLKIVKEIEAGKRPNVSSYGSDWSNLAKGYRRAADRVRTAPLVGDFDATPFALSAAQLANCHQSRQNIATLRGYETALMRVVSKARSDLATLAGEKERADSSAAAVRYLVEATRDASKLPVVGELFQWDWLALEAGVSPALGEYRQALNAQITKLTRELEKADRHRSNLAQNTELLETSTCQFVGQYAAPATPYQYRIFLIIERGPGGFVGRHEQRNNNGQVFRHPLNPLNFDGQRISFSFVNNSNVLSYSGTISSDYRTITVNGPGGAYTYRR